MKISIETEQETDGRWIAEVMEIPGAKKYGTTREEATAHAKALALGVLADRTEHGEPAIDPAEIDFSAV
jgi:predicted RNase H-like HicB family nuclease